MRDPRPIENGGRGAFKVLATGVVLALSGGATWYLGPDKLMRPNMEADPKSYAYVAGILRGRHMDYCPALRMEAQRAMGDGRLTITEEASLRDHASEYQVQHDAAGDKNQALEAAGLSQRVQGPDCPYGELVFSVYGLY